MNATTAMRTACSGAALLALSLGATAALANDAKTGLPDASIATSLDGGFDKDARAQLAALGITYGINYIGEGFANTGGVSQRGNYEGRLELLIDADLEKLFGLKGLTFHVNGYQIHGDRLSPDLGYPIMLLSNIEALPTTRLFELWAEQKFFDDKVAIRFGQLAADSEFFISTSASNFVNSTFGWAGIYAANLPNGGNGYPLATPGARVQLTLSDELTFRAAVYNGNPAGCYDDYGGQQCDPWGTNFPVGDGAFLMQELEYKYNQPVKKEGGLKDAGAKGSLKDAPAPAPTSFWDLPGTIKVGAWQNTLDFESIYTKTINNSPAGPVAERWYDNTYGFYGIIDQQIYALADDATKGVNVFARAAGAPSEQNLVNFYFDVGLVFTGLIPSRGDDSFGFGYARAEVSGDARDADRFIRNDGNPTYPIRNSESVIEAYYKYQVVPGFVIQPDIQYYWDIGGGIGVEDGNVYKRVDDAFVGGVRFILNY